MFSKEVRFGRYASVSSQPPGAVVATQAVLRDAMTVPPYNWRVPYVVVHGPPGAPLKALVRAPDELLRRGSALRCVFIGVCWCGFVSASCVCVAFCKYDRLGLQDVMCILRVRRFLDGVVYRAGSCHFSTASTPLSWCLITMRTPG